MLFDVNIYVAVQSPRGIWLALAVVALAGISESVGQSLVLFINKRGLAALSRRTHFIDQLSGRLSSVDGERLAVGRYL